MGTWCPPATPIIRLLPAAATGAYPYGGADGTYIEMAQTLCDAPPPAPPPSAAPGLATLLCACLHKAPGDRLPADVLLGAPWLRERGVVDLASARAAVREWLVPPTGTGTERPH